MTLYLAATFMQWAGTGALAAIWSVTLALVIRFNRRRNTTWYRR